MCRLFSFIILLLPYVAFAVQDAVKIDSLSKNILLREIEVAHKQEITTLNQQQQRATLQTPTDKVLERIPGIQMVRRGNYAWEPTLRSLNAGQINVTIDGMHIFGACTDRMDPVSSYIEPNNLNRISSHFGPDFDVYGGSIGGGINFKLKEALPAASQALKGTFGTGYETNAQVIQTLGSVSYSKSKFAVDANAIFRKSDNYQSSNRTEIPFSQYQKWNASLSAKYQFNHKHAISASYIQDEGRNIGYPALTMDVSFANAKIAALTHHYHHKNSKLPHLKTKIYYNFIDHAMDDTNRPPEQVPMHMDMPGKSWTGGFYSEAAYKPKSKHTLNTRLSGYINRLSADMTMYPKQGSPMYMYTIPDAQRTFLSFDFSDKIQMNQKLSITGNTTLSYNQSLIYSQQGKDQLSGMINENPSKNNLLWNAGLTTAWNISSQWQFAASVARAERNATLQEYFAFYIFNRLDGFDYLGNFQLTNERSVNLNMNIVHDRNWLRIEASGFSYFFSDYIAGRILQNYQVMTIGANGVKQYQNIGTAKIYGGEATLRITQSEYLGFSSINTYTRGVDENGFSLPLIAPFSTVNTLYSNFKGYYVQAELETALAQKRVSFSQYGETETPASSVFNIGLRKVYRFNKSAFTASFRVENIFDKNYHRHLDIMKIARPGRNFILNLTMAF